MPATQRNPEPVCIETESDADGTRIIHLSGHLDVAAVARVWDRLLRTVPGRGEVVLDAAGLSYCDGAGMALLHELGSRQRRGGGSLRIEGLRADLRGFLALTQPERELVGKAPFPSHLSIPVLVGKHTQEIVDDAVTLIRYLGAITRCLVDALLRPHRLRWAHVLDTCTVAGAFALPVVALIGFLLGWVLAFSSAFIMHDYGADRLLARLIGPAMVRELGPLMTCIVLAARSGSAFAAEIGTMKVNEELDALTTMGVDPVRFLVTPKVLAAVAMTPILTVFANLAGIVGGALVSTFILGQPLVVYTNLLAEAVTITDIGLGLVKAVIFGVIVAAVGCIRGLQTRNSPTAVGESTTRAVVTSIVFLAIADAIIAFIVQVLGI